VDAIALVKGAKHGDVAVQFYEYVSTPQALRDAAEKFLRIPARTDIPTDSLPEVVRRARTEVKAMPGDQKLQRDSLDAWMKYWDANIRNSRRGK
jgi:ABC-type thiamine transport system substrate-binding protein